METINLESHSLVMRFPPAAFIGLGKWVAVDSWLEVAAVGNEKIGVFQVIQKK